MEKILEKQEMKYVLATILNGHTVYLKKVLQKKEYEFTPDIKDATKTMTREMAETILKYYEYDNPLKVLQTTYLNLLNEINRNNYKNILLPSLGTGIYGFNHEEVGKMVVSTITEFIKDKEINIDLVLYLEKDKKYYEQ